MKETLTPKQDALNKFNERKNNPPKRIDNSSLPAGSSMYFYCKLCGHSSDILPESYLGTPRRLCQECQLMKDMGWLD